MASMSDHAYIPIETLTKIYSLLRKCESMVNDVLAFRNFSWHYHCMKSISDESVCRDLLDKTLPSFITSMQHVVPSITDSSLKEGSMTSEIWKQIYLSWTQWESLKHSDVKITSTNLYNPRPITWCSNGGDQEHNYIDVYDTWIGVVTSDGDAFIYNKDSAVKPSRMPRTKPISGIHFWFTHERLLVLLPSSGDESLVWDVYSEREIPCCVRSNSHHDICVKNNQCYVYEGDKARLSILAFTGDAVIERCSETNLEHHTEAEKTLGLFIDGLNIHVLVSAHDHAIVEEDLYKLKVYNFHTTIDENDKPVIVCDEPHNVFDKQIFHEGVYFKNVLMFSHHFVMTNKSNLSPRIARIGYKSDPGTSLFADFVPDISCVTFYANKLFLGLNTGSLLVYAVENFQSLDIRPQKAIKDIKVCSRIDCMTITHDKGSPVVVVVQRETRETAFVHTVTFD